MVRFPKVLLCLTMLLSTFAVTARTDAQVVDAAKKLLGVAKANAEFVPDSAFAGAVVFPKRLAEDPKYDIFPREIATAWGKKELGFDPMLITQATFIVKKMDNMMAPPQWAAVLHFEEMQGLAGGLIDKLEKQKVGDKVLFRAPPGQPSFLVYDEATMFVGDESLFEDMITATGKTRLAGLIRNSSVKGELQAFADVESVRPLLNMLLGNLPAGLPGAVNKLKTVPDLIDAIEIGVTIDGSVETQLVIHAADEDAAKSANKILKNALDLSVDMGIGVMASQMDFNDPVQEAAVEYAQRAGEVYRERLEPELNGKKLALSLSQEATVLPIAIGMILPAVQQVRAAARRATSMNNSRQMVLASLNYESAHRHWPAQASYDKNGKALLSWRVHMLPFIEQQALYDQFHLDEPWNSPHNRKLISKMPQTYRSPTSMHSDGKTVYLGISGEGSIFNGKQETKFADITDGSSNTAFMVEVDDSRAVEWTKPQDYEVDAANAMNGLGRMNPGGIIVTMADGSVQFMSLAVAPEEWLKLITMGGGEISSQ